MDQTEITQPPRVPSRYCGQWIAWNRDQSRIVASDPTLQAAIDAAIAAGESQPLLTKAPDAKTRFVGHVLQNSILKVRTPHVVAHLKAATQ